MGVIHSGKGVKHPSGRVRTLLETPETQMCRDEIYKFI